MARLPRVLAFCESVILTCFCRNAMSIFVFRALSRTEQCEPKTQFSRQKHKSFMTGGHFLTPWGQHILFCFRAVSWVTVLLCAPVAHVSRSRVWTCACSIFTGSARTGKAATTTTTRRLTPRTTRATSHSHSPSSAWTRPQTRTRSDETSTQPTSKLKC